VQRSPGFGRYQARAGRVIPMAILTPVPGPVPGGGSPPGA